MRIIHVITEPTGGGAELLVRELNHRLRLAGLKSCVLFLSNPRNEKLGVSEYCLGLRSPRNIVAAWGIRQFVRRFTSEKVIVHSHLSYPLYYLALMPRPSNSILVHTEHSTYNRRRSVTVLRPIERYVYSRFDAIACISEGVRTSLLDWVGGRRFDRRIVTVMNGGRLFQFLRDRPIASKNLTIVSVGSLTTRKGFDIGIDAISQAADVVDRYIIVGEGPERTNLMSKAELLTLRCGLEFAGWQKDIEPWLQKADLILIPSRWEGFGLVAIEALSIGLPVIASDVSGLNEVLSGCGAAFLVESGNTAAMAKKIREYASFTVAEKRRMAEQARARAEMYSFEAMTMSYKKLYEQLYMS